MTTESTPLPQSSITDPTRDALALLGMQLQAAMMGLATAGLAQDGSGAALVALDQIDAGKAELQLEAKRHATGFELVIWYASNGARQRLTSLRLHDQAAPPAADAGRVH